MEGFPPPEGKPDWRRTFNTLYLRLRRERLRGGSKYCAEYHALSQARRKVHWNDRMGYNARNDEIHENLERIRRAREAYEDALAVVRQFNARLSAKKTASF